LVDDWNGDEQLDILLAGNLFSSEIETPRNDASYGTLLTFNKKEKKMEVIANNESKIYTTGDTKKIKQIMINNKKCFIVGNNNERIQIFCSE